MQNFHNPVYFTAKFFVILSTRREKVVFQVVKNRKSKKINQKTDYVLFFFDLFRLQTILQRRSVVHLN